MHTTTDGRATERSLAGLNGLNFSVAAMQTGFGPFVAVYLTAQHWNSADIGFALGVGTAVAMTAQVPAGALVDAMASKPLAAAGATLATLGAALALAFQPVRLVAMAALGVQGAAGCVLPPAIAAITLALSHQERLGERLGHNVRFAAIGVVAAAALMGAAGYWWSQRAIFFLAAGFGLAALVALRAIRTGDLADAAKRTDHPAAFPQHTRAERPQRIRDLLRDHRLLVFAGGVALFQLGNAAVLPLAANALTRSSSQLADLVVPAVVIVPQVVAGLLSPWVGRLAQRHGRRAVMLVGFAVLPLRITLFALDAAPVPIICYQMLDGVAAAMLGVMVPLVAADITRRGGRFNLAMGIVGLASGLGATLSNTVAGAVSNQFGVTTAYIGLAVPALAAVLLIWLRMPDTGRSRSPATTKARPA